MAFRFPLLLHLFVALLVLKTDATPTESPCTIHDPSTNNYFDLNPLKSNADYKLTTSGGHDFYLNVCRGVTTDLWGLDDPEIGGFIRKDHKDFSVGLSNTTLFVKEGVPKIQMGKGSKCVSGKGEETGDLAETIVEFLCDRSKFEKGQPKLKMQFPLEDERACTFLVEWKTYYACPTAEPSGPWGFFTFLLVIILILLMLYLVFGTLYNRYVLRLRGFDQIPQFSVEAFKYHASEAFDWFKDSIGKSYEGTRRGTTNPVSHQAGVDVGSGLGGAGVERGFVRPGQQHPSTNPFSHQAGVDVGSGLGGAGVERGFVRPGPNRPSMNPVSHQAGVDIGSGFGRDVGGASVERGPGPQRPSTNPVSHHTNTNTTSDAGSQPMPPSPSPPPAKKKDKDTGTATVEERTFMLGDADEDEDDLGVNPQSNTSSTPQIQATQGDGRGEGGGIRL